MAKYHISKSGKPTLCKAVKKPCPLGDEYHFEADTKEEMQNKADAFHEKREKAIENLTPILDAIYNVGEFNGFRANLSDENKLAYDYYKTIENLYRDNDNKMFNVTAHLTREGKIDIESDFFVDIFMDSKHEGFNISKAIKDNSEDLQNEYKKRELTPEEERTLNLKKKLKSKIKNKNVTIKETHPSRIEVSFPIENDTVYCIMDNSLYTDKAVVYIKTKEEFISTEYVDYNNIEDFVKTLISRDKKTT